MAQKVQVVLVDDLDGGSADETLKFAVENTQYEIDLSTAHAAELRAAFAPWVAAARKVPGRSSAKSRSTSDTSKVRAWAKANGYDVSERGRISATVRSAYDAVH
ncbi:Lsr2 family protein [Demequina sp.]|uniref:histone-like nucleoid-structuring protein Lsr2 n=1 Tax=Demequina sp. TaxID=2050685 RepID=UPI0025BCA50D|nr:Lsr2 family protein [Demequina sp.]